MSIHVQSNNPEADKAVNAPKAPEAAAPATQETQPASAAESVPAEKEVASGATESEAIETESEVTPEAKTEKDETTEPANKKKNGFQKRVDKLNARIADKEREAEYWKQEALKNAAAPKPEPKAEGKPSAHDAEGKPKAEDYDTHAEFVEALTDWKLERKFKAKDAEASSKKVESEQQKLAREYTEREKAFADKTDDFQEVLEDAKSFGVPLSNTVRAVLVSSEHGPELLYQLAKDKDLFTKVNSLSPLDAAREIGKLESRLVKPSSEIKETKITKAPNPIAPIGSGGKSTIPKSLDELAKTDYQAYKRMREAEQTKRRRA